MQLMKKFWNYIKESYFHVLSSNTSIPQNSNSWPSFELWIKRQVPVRWILTSVMSTNKTSDAIFWKPNTKICKYFQSIHQKKMCSNVRFSVITNFCQGMRDVGKNAKSFRFLFWACKIGQFQSFLIFVKLSSSQATYSHWKC